MKKLLKFFVRIAVVFAGFIAITIVALWHNGKKEKEAYDRLIVSENEDSVFNYIQNNPDAYRIEELKAHARTLGTKLEKQETFDKKFNDPNVTAGELFLGN